MQYHFFNIPALYPEAAEQQLNRFLSSHSVLTVDREFVNDGAKSFWAVSVCLGVAKAVEELKSRNKRATVDYRDILSPEHFALFARLIDLRKAIAEEQSCPPYAVFNNEQLAAIVQLNEYSLQALSRIEGVGEKRVALYGKAFLAELERNDA